MAGSRPAPVPAPPSTSDPNSTSIQERLVTRHSFRRSALLLSCAAFLVAAFPPASLSPGTASGLDFARQSFAQEKKAEKAEPAEESVPVVVICAASADRLLNDVFDMFKIAGKPEMIGVIKGFLGNVDDLKGMDRTKPFGVMLYLSAGIPPTPSPVDGKPGRYEVIGPNRTLQVALKGGYAFIGNDESTLDREFPDPAKLSASLASRYDIAASANMNSIPKVTRELFATLLRSYSEAEFQQRDDEPDDVYQARKARGMRDLEFAEGLLLDGENLTIGLDANSKNKNAVIEVNLNARAKSKFGKLLRDIGGTYSKFANVLNAKAPMSISVSSNLRKSERTALVRNLRLAESRVSQGYRRLIDLNTAEKTEPKAGTPAKEQPAENKEDKKVVANHPDVSKIINSLIATANKGHADFFMQFVGTPPETFTLLGGARIEDGRNLAAGMTNILRQVKTFRNENVPEIELNATTYKGVNFHRITPKQLPRQMTRVFGEKPSFLVGAGSTTLWIAVGGAKSTTALRQAMDAAGDRSKIGQKKESSAPIQMAVNMSSWFALIGNGNGNGRPGAVRELATKAFSKGGDDIRVALRTTENGLRLRVKFGEGFIRFIGMAIYSRFERTQL
eukprot:g22029.t1